MKLKNDDQDQPNELPGADASGVDNTRRKLSKAGIIAPVLLSLSSKPVWAVDCVISGVMSGNTSRTCTNPPNGFTATEFIDAAAWPSPYVKASTTFDSVFGPSTGGSLFGTRATLLSVLNGKATFPRGFDFNAVFGCTGDKKKLKDALKAYAVQSIVSLLNDALFPNYAYPGAATFYSAISGSITPPTCDNRADTSITPVTTSLANLTT